MKTNKIKNSSMFMLAVLALSMLALSATVSASETILFDSTHGLKDFFAALPRLNSTDIVKMTQTVEIMKQNPINNTTVTQIIEVAKTAQKINTTTINQIAKAIMEVNNIQNNLSNRSD